MSLNSSSLSDTMKQITISLWKDNGKEPQLMGICFLLSNDIIKNNDKKAMENWFPLCRFNQRRKSSVSQAMKKRPSNSDALCDVIDEEPKSRLNVTIDFDVKLDLQDIQELPEKISICSEEEGLKAAQNDKKMTSLHSFHKIAHAGENIPSLGSGFIGLHVKKDAKLIEEAVISLLGNIILTISSPSPKLLRCS